MRTCLYRILTGTLLSGCATLQNLEGERTPFGGLAFDVNYALHGHGYVEDLYFRPVAVVDAPFSAVADTATLPITVAASISKEIDRRQYLGENKWRFEIAESAYMDEGGLSFGEISAADLDAYITGNRVSD